MDEIRELSFMEMSAICSNLAKACTKQLRADEANLFHQLSDYYKVNNQSTEEKSTKDLLSLIHSDLESSYIEATQTATNHQDRGALRALVWGEKVTKMLNALLNRYEKQKDTLLENTNIYVCEICGFLYVGNDLPAICPVCKVPNVKLTQVKREVS